MEVRGKPATLVDSLDLARVVLRVDRPHRGAPRDGDVVDVCPRPRDPSIVQDDHRPLVVKLLEVLTEQTLAAASLRPGDRGLWIVRQSEVDPAEAAITVTCSALALFVKPVVAA